MPVLKILDEIIAFHILSRLNGKEKISDKLVDMLTNCYKHDAYLSGGFLLECLLSSMEKHVFWNSDIDLYCNPLDIDMCANCSILGENSSNVGSFLCKLTDLLYPNLYMHKSNLRSYGFLSIASVYTWELDPIKIDEIIIKKRETMNEVFAMFDFSFCKNIYNGRKLLIHDPNSILTRSCIFKIYNNKEFEKQNICMCTKNRHELEIIKCECPIEIVMLRSTLKRVEKYKERGFKVEIIEATKQNQQANTKSNKITNKRKFNEDEEK